MENILTNDIKTQRNALRAEAERALNQAEKALAALVESYPAAETYGSMHPRTGFMNTRSSVTRLLKALRIARV